MLPTNTEKMEPTERKEPQDIAIHLKGTNGAYLLHFPTSAMENPMPIHDKIIVQLLSEIESRDRLLEAADSLIDMVHIPPETELNEALEKYQALKQQSKT